MKTVFFDVDTQLDFLYPAGALYAPGAEVVVPNVAALNRYAASKGIVVVSTMDAHLEDDPEFETWPPHCVVDTAGQQKAAATLLERRATVPYEPAALPDVSNVQQVILQKRSVDCFLHPKIHDLLDQLGAERYVVYGVVTEVCVMHAALGLLATRRRVEIVTDAVQSFDAGKADEFLRDFAARGGALTTIKEVLVN